MANKASVVPYGESGDADNSVAATREERDVHAVYEAIAPHFSSTRYKPWPLIASYLSRIPPHSIGLDSGAGNGKYLPVLQASSEGSVMLALDRSSGLLEIAQKQGSGDQECLRGDLCFQGWREGVFDFVISIAAIHHLSTHARRVESVRSMLKPLTYRRSGPFASFIVYVWAFEQSENSKRKMGSAAVEGSGDGMTAEQDVLVPWVLQSQTPSSHENQNTQPRVYHRYYHLFKQGELRELVLDAAREEGLMINNDDGNVSGQGGKWLRIVGEGYEKDNWWLEGEVGAF